MTDNEIIKALEHCASGNTSAACYNCPFDRKAVCANQENALAIHSLDLVRRLKCDKRLTIERNNAINDFKAALLKKIFPYDAADKKQYSINAYAVEKAIEEVAKQMTRG